MRISDWSSDVCSSDLLLKYRSFGYGHSFGVLCHYYGREAGVELREDIETELKPGMVVSMEPMVMLQEGVPGAGGFRQHDILIVPEDGAANNTGFPIGPEHNFIRKCRLTAVTRGGKSVALGKRVGVPVARGGRRSY